MENVQQKGSSHTIQNILQSKFKFEKNPKSNWLQWSDEILHIYIYFFNFMHKQFWRGLWAGGKDIVKESRHNAKLWRIVKLDGSWASTALAIRQLKVLHFLTLYVIKLFEMPKSSMKRKHHLTSLITPLTPSLDLVYVLISRLFKKRHLLSDPL